MTLDQHGGDLDRRLERFSMYTTTPAEALALFEDARARCPVAHSSELGEFYIALRYEDVRAAHRDARTFSSSPSVTRPLADRPPFPPLEMDEPEHTPWRRLFNRAFDIMPPERLAPLVEAEVTALIDHFAPRGSAELVTEFAQVLPVTVLCHLIGIERDRRNELLRLVNQFHQCLDDPGRSPAAFLELADFGVAQVLERREYPRDDFLTEIAHAEIEGRPLDDLQIGMLMNSFMGAGAQTAISAISTLFHEVLIRPELRAQLAAEPAAIPAVVEENLRLNPPFFGLFRRATRRTEMGGVQLEPDDSVFMCWAAANRDPERFENPAVFQPDRSRNRHLSFGFGVHTCPGATSARLQLRIGLEQLLHRLPDIALDAAIPPNRVFAGTEILALDSLHVMFRPSAGRERS